MKHSMLKPVKSEKLKRLIRQDDWEVLGISTPEKIVEAINERRYEEAKALARYYISEGKRYTIYSVIGFGILPK